MGHRLGRPNCRHLDNYRRCRVHPLLPWWIRWLAPGGRPICLLDREPPQDGEATCPDQRPRPRPAPPAPMKGEAA